VPFPGLPHGTGEITLLAPRPRPALQATASQNGRGPPANPYAPNARCTQVLMKYIYRGLGTAKKDQDHYKSLLKWHPKVLAIAGPASIVRAMAEVARPL